MDDRVTVLVVEDDPDMRSYLRGHLDQRFRVLEAADGVEGLRIAHDALPDLVVTDIVMPRMEGVELTRRLKTAPELDYLPVILLTAKGHLESKLAGLGEGADDYLVKPFDARELLARIDRLLALRRRLRERRADGAGAMSLIPLPAAERLSREDRAFLERIRQVIESDLGDDEFNVQRLAVRLAVDRTQLFRRLKRITGRTPSELILETRLCRAAELLSRGEGRVGEIAVAVGFKSVSHFSERFRRQFGTVPSACLRRRTGDRRSV